MRTRNAQILTQVNTCKLESSLPPKSGPWPSAVRAKCTNGPVHRVRVQNKKFEPQPTGGTDLLLQVFVIHLIIMDKLCTFACFVASVLALEEVQSRSQGMQLSL